jgi:serine O-acetyltransferase
MSVRPGHGVEAGGSTRVSDPARTSWLRLFLDDVARYREYKSGVSILNIVTLEQALWAMLQYRVASSVFRSTLPPVVKRPALVLLTLWQKLIEMITGISISYQARIGRGFCIWHFGNIFVGEDVQIGEMCNISQGVTLGVGGQGSARGAPTLGDRVCVGANAVVAGKISVGDDAAIAANSLVIQNVPPRAVVVGVPARSVSNAGSAHLLHPFT